MANPMMMLCTATLLMLFNPLPICYSEWVQHSSPKLPRSDSNIAVGHYNGSIYLLYVLCHHVSDLLMTSKCIRSVCSGGKSYGHQVVEYDISEDTFVDIGTNVLGPDVTGTGQYYTQYDATTMYTIDSTCYACETLFTFNLKSLEFNTLSDLIPMDVGTGGCIASSTVTASLYINGGYDRNTTQVFELNSQIWHPIAEMKIGRYTHGCLVEQTTQRLYSVGGPVSSIEYINTKNIGSNDWVMLDQKLPTALSYFHLVAVNGIMYTIGGRDVSGYVDKIYSIDAATGVVTTHFDSLPTALYGTAAVVVDNTIYAFGGYNGGKMDSWMTYALPTTGPSAHAPIQPVDSAMFSEMTTSWNTKDVIIIILVAMNMALIAATMMCQSKQRSVRVHKYEDVSVGSESSD